MGMPRDSRVPLQNITPGETPVSREIKQRFRGPVYTFDCTEIEERLFNYMAKKQKEELDYKSRPRRVFASVDGGQRLMPAGYRAAWFTADYLLGRRFQFVAQDTPDISVTGFDPEKQRVRVHVADGGKHWIPFNLFYDALMRGVFEESMQPAFVHPR